MCAGHNTRSGVKLSNGPVRRTQIAELTLSPPLLRPRTDARLSDNSNITQPFPQPLHNRFPTPHQPSGTSTRPQPSFNSFIATDKQNPSPTIFQPPRHRAAKWLDIRSHEEAPTLIQPFPNTDIGIVSRNSTTTIAQPRPNHDPTPQDGYLRSRRQICRDCAYPPRNSV